ncbi:tRNA 4-thiouridine(8) synthase ThiI [Microbulbifer flavimaris]|uniref:tRNA sulfurtransferase n=1 Tax=Microbulbifer flavimaris TaxID=1781068 RepID=A0ABX4I2N7_9GAMM|nr:MULTISPECIES: tRNA uracil 4-sulfurtransferase ThiI [Microbulbifer]KUJ83856.1 tRNA s(4)U8 sulfurtransferase [Microbulbifer sp. ZGT114]PCO06033.1 tRNA 4-thiouridine(8) synthase ThiI [Microbulbifer flavimaris]
MHFVVKFFPEITIKSNPVRKRMSKQLKDNLRILLHRVDDRIKILKDWEKIEVIAPDAVAHLAERIEEVLAHTPGIANFARVQQFPLGDLHDMYEKTLSVWGDKLDGKTFCVRVKRSGQHDFQSLDVEQYVGGGLNKNTGAAGVKLRNPDITVKLEVRHDKLNVVEEVHQGLGGFPLGTQDPVLSLVSGGFDSIVASYMTMKRGIRTHFLFFNLGGRQHELGVKEVAYYLWNRYGSSHRVKFVSVPFDEVVAEILTNVDDSHMGVILKRMMMRAATVIANELNMDAIVTGEAIAQVSSQTLKNLSVIDSVTDTLVLRPLIVSDKTDIIRTAREIGTEEFAANMPEYCGVISVKPTTKAKRERVEEEESHFDFTVLDRAVSNRVMQNIDQVMEEVQGEVPEVEVVGEAGDAVIIDIRHPDEEEMDPLELEDSQVKVIPFYRLNSVFGKLDPEQKYLLYCSRGVMSKLHASHLIDEGYRNVAVLRPHLPHRPE